MGEDIHTALALRQVIKDIVKSELQECGIKVPQGPVQTHFEDTEILKVKNESLEEEVTRLKKQLSETQLKAKEEKSRLHKIIIDNGAEEDGPTDDVVEKAVGQLHHAIFQFVMKHCQNFTRKEFYASVPAEARNCYLVGLVADNIHADLFHPQKRIYGFHPRDDARFMELENALVEKVPYAEITEWRVRTCQLSKSIDPEGRFNDAHCEELASALYEKLSPACHFHKKDVAKKGDPKVELFDIYCQGFALALLFRRSKVEFKWLHRDRALFRPLLEADEVEVVASAGFKSFPEARHARDDFLTVFGELVKGTGPTGRIEERSLILRPCKVLLGPLARLKKGDA